MCIRDRSNTGQLQAAIRCEHAKARNSKESRTIGLFTLFFPTLNQFQNLVADSTGPAASTPIGQPPVTSLGPFGDGGVRQAGRPPLKDSTAAGVC